MTDEPARDLHLRDGVMVPAETISRFLWGNKDAGIAWFADLPGVLDAWCDQREITLDPALPNPGVNLVLFGHSPRYGDVVIKTSPPHEETAAEIAALCAHNGSSEVVRVIEADPSVSIMLQQRLRPGTTLRSEVTAGRLTERDAAEIGAGLLHAYWMPPPEDATFFTLERWFRALFAYREAHPSGGRIPHDHLGMAIAVATDVLGTQGERVMLHGDLHHDNILFDEDQGWTIIDPKGLVGERGYDIAHWLTNPVGVDRRPDLARLTSDRLDWFSELLGIDRFRLWQWAMPHAVLSDCWTLEGDGDAYLYARAIADALFAMPEARAYR